MEDFPDFELENEDRVVLLGNSLIQYDQQHGYIEYALTTRWPQKDITFRNLGWTGDTVHGKARTYYTTPPGPYELLIDQLKEVEPTVVFVGYGANEAYEGEEGIPDFRQGLNKLLDDIEKMEARAVLLSPIPHMSQMLAEEELNARNKNLKLYSEVIAEVASARHIRFINLFKPFQGLDNSDQFTTDGVHLNENGYYYLASVMEDGLGLPPRKWRVEIDRARKDAKATGMATILEAQFGDEEINFTLGSQLLPLPPPDSDTVIEIQTRDFTINGLGRGCYTLSEGPADIISASAERWSEGVEIERGLLFEQANELQELIVNKNQLYFRKYRPVNRTYLVGFRSFEQGQNTKELEQLDLFITRMEDQVFQLRKPQPKVYRVHAVK
ncbi:SGNH/GDSL hydrolase family protein [Fodinibius sediminis]|uniref:SGNH/GDSL hydrolase family protein n=1 Tax=Fodinibius sediminis TaxID=1214077 RepID=UPI00163DB53B|nr:SGNH/GDSL hydrolase family protein [Fodinibius sediminis]